MLRQQHGLPTFEEGKMRDEPEPEEHREEHQPYSVYEQAQRYRAAKAILQDIDALDEEHAEAVKELERLWSEGYTVAAHQLGKIYLIGESAVKNMQKALEYLTASAEQGNQFAQRWQLCFVVIVESRFRMVRIFASIVEQK